MSITLERTDSTNADSINVEIMTLDQFSQLDTSVSGSCPMRLENIGVPDINQVDQAERKIRLWDRIEYVVAFPQELLILEV